MQNWGIPFCQLQSDYIIVLHTQSTHFSLSFLVLGISVVFGFIKLVLMYLLLFYCAIYSHSAVAAWSYPWIFFFIFVFLFLLLYSLKVPLRYRSVTDSCTLGNTTWCWNLDMRSWYIKILFVNIQSSPVQVQLVHFKHSSTCRQWWPIEVLLKLRHSVKKWLITPGFNHTVHEWII